MLILQYQHFITKNKIKVKIIKKSLMEAGHKKAHILLVLHISMVETNKIHNRFQNFDLSCIKNHCFRIISTLSSIGCLIVDMTCVFKANHRAYLNTMYISIFGWLFWKHVLHRSPTSQCSYRCSLTDGASTAGNMKCNPVLVIGRALTICVVW